MYDAFLNVLNLKTSIHEIISRYMQRYYTMRKFRIQITYQWKKKLIKLNAIKMKKQKIPRDTFAKINFTIQLLMGGKHK